MKTWAITIKTGHNVWSTIEIEASDHEAAIREAHRLIGPGPVTEIV